MFESFLCVSKVSRMSKINKKSLLNPIKFMISVRKNDDSRAENAQKYVFAENDDSRAKTFEK